MSDTTPAEQALSQNEQIQQRYIHLDAWREAGHDPFGKRVDGVIATQAAQGLFQEDAPEDQPEPTATVAGRLMTIRLMGKSIFADLQDSSGRIQIYARKNALGDDSFADFKRLDIGDIITVSGSIFKTRMGEITLKVEGYTLLSKALLPLPDKHAGLTNVEIRHRQRYLDLIANPESLAIAKQRIQIIREIRAYMESADYLEVETPMIQAMPGGAAARPFETHYNALDCKMFMRIAPELYLKRLLVGGMERVFEINRNFRNEGLSRQHNPEFTMLEAYQAYGNCETMMELIEDLICTVAEKVCGTLTIEHANGKVIDLTRPWKRIPFNELIAWHGGADWYESSHEDRVERGKTLGLSIDADWTDTEIDQEMYEKLIEPTLINPTFVTRLPKEMVPLAKTCADDDTLVDVYELAINGQEISPGYTELNDPIEQRKRFESQLEANPDDPEVFGKIDEDFLTALQHGMPPAGGLGLGIDRLVMMLTGAESIREVILFPHLRPKHD